MVKKVLCVCLASVYLFAGCTKKSEEPMDNESEVINNPGTVDFAKSSTEMFSDRDFEVGYDESQSAQITLKGNTASCDSDAVKIDGSTVTISDEGTYIISGNLEDGNIIVNADEKDKPQIVLKGASVTSKTTAALYILEADKVFITLADGSENTLENGGEFKAIDENNIDGAVFSKQDLTFNGLGSLTVISPAGHGIVCKDDVVFTSGTYTVNSASHSIDANDSVRVANAKITLDAGKDGIHSENNDDSSLGFFYCTEASLNIEAEGDGISAASFVQIENGTFNIVTGGGYQNGEKQTSDSWGGFMGGTRPSEQNTQSTEDSTSIKGIKSSGSMLINNGNITVNSADDSVHSNASVFINGGTLTLSSGDDGMHADEELNITGGKINIIESYEGLEALDIKISGGEINITATDDGLNAAGGNDSSGMGGMRPGADNFGRRGGMGAGSMSGSSNGSIDISGGDLYIEASGDGIDANGTLLISGGYTVVVGPTRGDTATLDYDSSGVITGGTFIGTGASGMAQSFSSSENQGVVAVSVGNSSAETTVTLADKKGKTIISYTPKLSFAVVILSSPDIIKGETYKITVGSQSGELTAE